MCIIQAENSRVFLNWSDFDGVEVILSQTAAKKAWYDTQNFICIEHSANAVFFFVCFC